MTVHTWAVVADPPLQGEPLRLFKERMGRIGLDPEGKLGSLPVDADVVLLLGNEALKAVTGKGGITKNRGSVSGEKPELTGPTYFATLHPSMIVRTPNYVHEWVKDLSAFQQLVNPPNEDINIIIVDSYEKVDEAVAASGAFGAVDIETDVINGTVDPWTEFHTLVSVAVTWNGDDVFVFKNDRYLVEAKPQIEATQWVMHNGLFDRLMMHRFGYDLTLKHDTMAMAYLLHEEDRKGLEVLSSVYLGLPPYKGVDYEHILDEPWDKVATMNAIDASRTFKLFRPLADEINQHPDLSRIYQWLLVPAVNALIEVTENGVPVDTERLAALAVEIERDRDETLAWIQTHTPEPAEDEYPDGWPRKRKADPAVFNPGSYKQVGHVLYDLWGLPALKVTDSGNLSTDEDTLTQLQLQDIPSLVKIWLDRLLQMRELNKQMSSYIEAWPKLLDRKGWLHPRYKPLHVTTGRLSSEHPNIQQVPRDKRFRNVFGGVEGMTWMKADYSQIELRLAAWAAQEEKMLEAYADGGDLHRLTASLVLGDDSDEARQVGKTLNFGLLYGAGPGTLQRVARTDYGLDLSAGEAKRYRERFFQAYPALLDWHRTQERIITSSGKSISPLGRVRHLPEALGFDDALRNGAIRQGINHPIQSFASDMLLMSLVRVRENLSLEGLGAKVICEVHDEMDLLVPDAEVMAVASLVKSTMEDTSWLNRWGIHLTVPVFAEIETGSHWGFVSKLEA